MKRIKLLLTIILLGNYVIQAENLISPDNNFRLDFTLNEKGEPTYSLAYKGKTVIKPSKLGFELLNAPALSAEFSTVKAETSTVDETWQPVWGEVKEIRNNYNELLVVLEQKKEKRTMKIRFRLFNDGLGFRYEFDKQANLNYFRIADEKTEFALTDNHEAFWIPGDYDTNEYYYSTTKLSKVDASKVDGEGIGTHGYFAKNAVQTPLMLKTDDKLYINIFEAALVNYPAMGIVTGKQIGRAHV